MQKAPVFLIFLFVLLSPNPSFSHDLRYNVTRGDAVKVKLFFADGREFSHEHYEIFRLGEDVPFQVGRTDAQGRITFVPDGGGSWRIKVYSEDGHGTDVTIEIDEHNLLIDADRPLIDRYSRLLVGIALIFGLFGLFSIFYKWKRS